MAPPPPQFVGAWVPTPPGYLPRLEPAAGSWRTWWLTGGDQFRPAPPLRPGDAGYAAQVQEVYDVSRALTPAERAIAELLG